MSHEYLVLRSRSALPVASQNSGEWPEYGEIVVPPGVNGSWRRSRIMAVPNWRSVKEGEGQ